MEYPKEIAPAKHNPNNKSKIQKAAGAIYFDSVALVYQERRIGLKITGGLDLAAFRLELMGLGMDVPVEVFSDPSKLTEIAFHLDGLGLQVKKGPLNCPCWL